MAEKITVTYGVKRSAEYQSVDVSVTVERDVAPGQTLKQAFDAAVEEVAPLVQQESLTSIKEVLGAMRS